MNVNTQREVCHQVFMAVFTVLDARLELSADITGKLSDMCEKIVAAKLAAEFDNLPVANPQGYSVLVKEWDKEQCAVFFS